MSTTLASKTVALPWVDKPQTLLITHDGVNVESRLLAAVADALGIQIHHVSLVDSFVDLGGNEQSAAELRNRCLSSGMDLDVEDILRCQTMAELETCIKPYALQAMPMPPTRQDPIDNRRAKPWSACRLSSCPDRDNTHSSTMSDGSIETERFLSSTNSVSSAIITHPKAGLFDGKAVVVLSLASFEPADTTGSHIHLIPDSRKLFAGVQVATLIKALEGAEPWCQRPHIWAVIDRMPMTNAGQVDRRQVRTWIQNANEALFREIMSLDTSTTLLPAITSMEKAIQRLVACVLGLSSRQVGMNLTFTQLGGEGTAASSLVARCNAESIYIYASELFEDNSLADIALIASRRGSQAHGPTENPNGAFELAPIQQLYLQAAMSKHPLQRVTMAKNSFRYNQSVILDVRDDLCLEDISAAFDTIVGHHPMLRARFKLGPEGWTQSMLPDVDGSYTLGCYSSTSGEELESFMDYLQASIDIEEGPVFAAGHFDTAESSQMLYLVAHHLVIDHVSWRVIIRDLDELLMNGSLSSQRSLPFRRWAETSRRDPKPLPSLWPNVTLEMYRYWGVDPFSNTYGETMGSCFSLSSELTALLETTCNHVFRTEPVDIFLAALLLAFARTFSERSLPAVWTQWHGRDAQEVHVDVSETIGLFTSLSPLEPSINGTDDFLDVLKKVKDERRGILLSRAENTAPAPNARPCEVLFNYVAPLDLGREISAVKQLTSPCSDTGPEVGRIALFEVNATIEDGEAKLRVVFNRNLARNEKVSAWIHSFEHLLLEAISRLRHHNPQLTISDLPRYNVTSRALAKLNDTLAAVGLNNPQEVEDAYPVTPTQQHVLVSQALDPEACWLRTVYEVMSRDGDPVDTRRICSAWQDIVARHAALRTIFIDNVNDNSLYDAVVLRESAAKMLFLDASGSDPMEVLDELPDLNCQLSEPLHRLTICRAPMKTFLQFEVSMALCDTESISVLLSEFRKSYISKCPAAWAEAPSTADYARTMASRDRLKSLNFWQRRLSDVRPCLFPRLVPRLMSPKFETFQAQVDINPRRLSDFSRAGNVGMCAILRMAWGLVLRAFTGSGSVCFGYQEPGRADTMTSAVGSLASVVPCTIDFTAATTLAEILFRTEQGYKSSLEHSYVAFPEIKHTLGRPCAETLFNTVISFTSMNPETDANSTSQADIKLRHIFQYDTSDYDLMINMRLSNGKLHATIRHSILSETQTVGLVNTLSLAIRAIIFQPRAQLSEIDLFCDRDYAQIVSWGYDSPSADRALTTVQELVAAKAASQRDAQAICSWDGNMSYSELQDLSIQVASMLVEVGVTCGLAVPTLLSKSRLSVVSMLAVLKTGAVLVPVDAEEPGRLQSVSEQLKAKLVVTCGSETDLGMPFETVIVIDEDLVSRLQARDPVLKTELFLSVQPDHDACISFTPTSNRRVRGIAFTHTALATAFVHQGVALGIDSSSRVMQLSSFNTDIALSEIFTTLVNGGCICVPTDLERIQDFPGAVRRMDVTWSYMTPTLSRRLPVDELQPLKTICFNTIRLDQDTYALWAGKKRVVTAYAAPEVGPLGVAFMEVYGSHQLRCIGRPTTGTVWIVDPEDRRRLMPIGAVGELVIEGPTLGRRYSPDGSITSATTPFELHGGRKTRYFKTGHRTRYTDGGLIQYVSSKGEDVEISGGSIAVDEIECLLRRCLGNSIDVAVGPLMFRGRIAEPIIGAFIELGCLFNGHEDLSRLSPSTRERACIARNLADKALRKSLPSAMIPSIFIPVRQLPITHSLGLDWPRLQKLIRGRTREQLLALSRAPTGIEAKGEFKPLPLTRPEERMRNIWSVVLGMDDALIALSDGFLDVGGDEVLAAELVLVCRRAGMSISISDVLGNVTLTSLCRSLVIRDEPGVLDGLLSPPAAVTTSQPTNAVSQPVVEQIIASALGVSPEDIEDIAEASGSQMRSYEAAMLINGANMDHLVFNLTSVAQSKKLQETCQLLVNLHPILRTVFVPYKRKLYQAVLRNYQAHFKRHLCPSFRLAALVDKSVKQGLTSAPGGPGPATKFTLFDAGNQAALIIRLSKAQYDDVSVSILVRDFKRLYRGMQPLARLPRTTASYCDLVRSSLEAALKGSEDYWRALLTGSAMTQVTEQAKPLPPVTKTETIRKRITIRSLKSLGVSFDTVLKAAWAIVLATISASSDVVFGELVEARHVRPARGSVSDVVGPAANSVPVRIRFTEPALAPLELLQHVHAQRLAGIPHEHMDMSAIAEKCTPWPSWARFSTVVRHVCEDMAILPGESKLFLLGPSSCELRIMESAIRGLPDLFVQSAMRGRQEVDLAVTFGEERVPGDFATEMLDRLCSAIAMVTSPSCPPRELPSASVFEMQPKRIPLPDRLEATPALADVEARQRRLQIEMAIPPDHNFRLRAFVEEAWSVVLEPEAPLHRAARFYDISGSLIPAEQLASFFMQGIRGLFLPDVEIPTSFSITTEDIIEHPAMLAQFEMIARRLYSSEPKKTINRKPHITTTAGRRKTLAVIDSPVRRSIRQLASSIWLPLPTARHCMSMSVNPDVETAITSPVTPVDQGSLGVPTPWPFLSPEEHDVSQASAVDSSSPEGSRKRSASTSESHRSIETMTEGSSANSRCNSPDPSKEEVMQRRTVELSVVIQGIEGGMSATAETVGPWSPMASGKMGKGEASKEARAHGSGRTGVLEGQPRVVASETL